MQEIKKILEKIQRPREDELVPAWWIRDNILSFVDQALAKLKEEPEQGDFTKIILASLERGDCGVKAVTAWLKEVCRRYDWLVKRNAKLHAEIKETPESEFTKKVRENWPKKTFAMAQDEIDLQYEQLEEACKIIDQLQAENKKLIEGQMAKLQAGS